MAEPGLSEILHAPADPERGTGTPAVVIDTSPTVGAVGRAAQMQQENDWRKYNLFLNNLKDVYKDAQDISSMEVASQDRDGLRDQMGKVFQKIGENPRGFFTGGPEMMEVQKDLAKLRSNATESKMNQTYDMAHREFLTRNPQWATPDNIKAVDSYLNQPLGKRKSFLLSPQPILDFDKLSSSINTTVGRNFANSGFTGVDASGNRVPGSNYIFKEKGRTYPTDRYLQLAEQSYDYPGEYGIKNRQAAEQAFKQLPPETQQAYGDAKNWYLTQLMARHKENEIQDSTLTPNRFAELSMREQFQYGLEAYKQGNRKNLAEFKHNLSNSGAPANINFLVRQYSSIMGNKTGQKEAVQADDGKYVQEDILNVPPDVIKKLTLAGKTTIKSGKGSSVETTTISREPDLFTRTKNGDLRAVYFDRYGEKDKRPSGKQVGDIKQEGRKNIYETSITVPKRELMGLLGKDFLEKKMVGTSIDAADKIFKDQGDNINGFFDKVNSGDEENDEDDEDVTKSSNTPTSGAKSNYKLNGKTFTKEQIQKAAKASGLSFDDYVKQVGLK